jgi:hypothetical protein
MAAYNNTGEGEYENWFDEVKQTVDLNLYDLMKLFYNEAKYYGHADADARSSQTIHKMIEYGPSVYLRQLNYILDKMEGFWWRLIDNQEVKREVPEEQYQDFLICLDIYNEIVDKI